MTPRACLECGLPDPLPNSDYCIHCLTGEVVLTMGKGFLAAFGIGAVGALVAWCLS